MPRCERCGREIFWAIAPNGRRTPLEKAPAVYRVKRGYSQIVAEPAEIAAPECLYVLHYRVCSALTGATRETQAGEQCELPLIDEEEWWKQNKATE